MELDADWTAYRTTGDLAARNRIVEHYLPIVERVAARLGPFLAQHADQDDLVSYGTFGLIDAVSKFNPETSTNFQGFAWKRIKGEILDQLRRHDSVRRNLRLYARQINNAKEVLTARLQRVPTDRELAAELGMSADQLAEHLANVAVTERPVSLDSLTPSGLALTETLAGGDQVEETHAIEELREVVVIAWNALPTRERTMLSLRYVEGLTLTEAGKVLGIAPSRVSQLHGDAIRMLRTGISRL